MRENYVQGIKKRELDAREILIYRLLNYMRSTAVECAEHMFNKSCKVEDLVKSFGNKSLAWLPSYTFRQLHIQTLSISIFSFNEQRKIYKKNPFKMLFSQCPVLRLYSYLILAGSVIFVERNAVFLCIKEDATTWRGGGKMRIFAVKYQHRQSFVCIHLDENCKVIMLKSSHLCFGTD